MLMVVIWLELCLSYEFWFSTISCYNKIQDGLTFCTCRCKWRQSDVVSEVFRFTPRKIWKLWTMIWIFAFTNHSSTPAFLRAHLVTSLGTLIKCFFQIYKSKEELLSFTPVFLLHLPYCEDWIYSSFPWHKSKLHCINHYFLSDPSFKHTFCHFHCMFQ